MTSFTACFWFISLLTMLRIPLSTACNSPVSCVCGSTNNTYTLCIDDLRNKENPCNVWFNCRTCRDNVSNCVTCPENRSGPKCLEVNHRREKRHHLTSKPRRLGITEKALSSYSRSQMDVGTRCGQPEADPNGFIQDHLPQDPRKRGRKFNPGTQLTFGCRVGFRSVGAVILYCLLSGEWSSLPPRCEQTRPVTTVAPTDAGTLTCRHPGDVSNGEIEETNSINPRSQFLPGDQLTYICNMGFRLNGPNVLFCLTNGKWSSSAPKCTQDSRIQDPDTSSTAVNCPNLGQISNGRIITVYRNIVETRRLGEIASDYPPGTRLEYSCEPKYIVLGDSTLVCLSNGYWNNEPPMCVEDCGLSRMQTTRKITRGLKTLAGEWPWTVAISPASSRNSVICGGALLDRRTVLTAAHCLVDYPSFALHFGKHHRRNSGDDAEVKRAVTTRIIIHQDFNNNTFENDIALLRFEPSVRYTDRIQPICLPTPYSTQKNVVRGKVGKVAGWGLNENKLQSDELMLGQLPIQPDEECKDAYRRHGLGQAIYPGMFCAGYSAANSTSACRGDSGSPLVFSDEENNRYTVEGVVSFGPNNRECGSQRAYTVFTKVAHYMTWIIRSRSRN